MRQKSHGGNSGVGVGNLTCRLNQLKRQIQAERTASIKEKVEKNRKKLEGHISEILSATTSRNFPCLEEKGFGQMLCSRIKIPLRKYTGFSQGSGDGDNANGHEVISSTNARLPYIEKLPPYTTWIFLDKNQRMTEDQSVVGRRRIYYDQHGTEALICSDSEEDIAEPEEEKHEFSEGEDRILWTVSQEYGLGEEILNAISQFIGVTISEIQEWHGTLTEKYNDENIKDSEDSVSEKGISLDKSLSAALDSFDNLFCRHCLLFDCCLHGCSQTLINPSERQPYWSEYEDDRKPCSDQCYLRLRAVKDVSEGSGGNALCGVKTTTLEEKDRTASSDTKELKTNVGADLRQDEGGISKEVRLAALEGICDLEGADEAQNLKISPMPIDGESSGKRKASQERNRLLDDSEPCSEGSEDSASKKQKTVLALDVATKSSEAIPSQDRSPNTENTKSRQHDVGTLNENETQITAKNTQNESCEQGSGTISCPAGASGDKTEDNISNGAKDVVEVPELKCSSSEWKPIERELYLKGVEIFGRNSCLIARNLLSGLKTCIEVSSYMRDGGASALHRSIMTSSVLEENGKSETDYMEKVEKNRKKLEGHISEILSATTSRNFPCLEEKGFGQMLCSRIKIPLRKYTGFSQGSGDGDNANGHEVISSTNARLPYIEKLPPYTTWIFLDKNQRMTEDQSVVGRRRIYYDQHGTEALICSDSEEDIAEPEEEKHEFSEGEDRILWTVSQEYGLGEEILNAISQFIGVTISEIQEWHGTLTEKYNDENIKDSEDSVSEKGISLDKSLSAALDSFDNLFCRHCLLFDCCLHGCSQTLINPSERQPYWSEYEDDRKPCSDQCYLRLRAVKDVSEGSGGNALCGVKTTTLEEKDRTASSDTKELKTNVGADLRQDEGGISKEVRLAALEGICDLEGADEAQNLKISPMPIDGESSGKRKASQERNRLLDDSEPCSEGSEDSASKKQKTVLALDVATKSSEAIPSQDRSPNTENTKSRQHDVGTLNENETQITAKNTQNESCEQGSGTISCPAGASGDKTEDNISNGAKDVVEVPELKCSSSEWKPIERELYLKGVEIFGRNSCLIARNLLSGLKTCIEVSSYMRDGGASALHRSIMTSSVLEENGKSETDYMEKVEKNRKKLEGHISEILSATTSRNFPCLEEKGFGQMLCSRIKIPLRKYTGFSQGSGDGDNANGHEVISSTNARLPYIEKLPPYTTWIFLDKNQRMTEDQSVVGRRRIYYDQHGTEALICSDSEEDIAEPEEEKHEFSEGEDRILWTVSQEYGLGEEILNAISQFIGVTISEIQEWHGTLTEKYNDENIKDSEDSVSEKGISLDKSLSAALDSFDNLFCRHCLLFDCCLHGCSQTLINPSERQPYWSEYEDDRKPCSDQCYLRLRAVKDVSEGSGGNALCGVKTTTLEEKDRTASSDTKELKTNVGADLRQDEGGISKEVRLAALEGICDLEGADEAQNLKISPMPIDGESSGKRKASQERNRLLDDSEPCSEGSEDSASKKQKTVLALDVATKSSEAIPSQDRSPNTENTKSRQHDVGTLNENETQITAKNTQNESCEQGSGTISCPAGASGDKTEDNISNGAKDVVEVPELKCSSSEWKPIERELYLKGVEIFGRNSCLIARNLLSGLKTCIEVSSYMRDGGASALHRSIMTSSVLEENGKSETDYMEQEMSTRQRMLRRRGRTRKLKYSWKSAGHPSIWKRIADGKNQSCKQYTPCGCRSMCGKQCPCQHNGTCCEKYCGCSKSCKNRFRGCHCAKSQCRSRQCPCFAAGRECDPDVCRNCWVSCGGGSLGEPPKQGDGQCGNMRLLLRQQQRILLAKSDVAGWGAFLKV
ncbi:hypothetical protein DITRI_Ditri11bG0118100 [Diplodiscus trichospermus]